LCEIRGFKTHLKWKYGTCTFKELVLKVTSIAHCVLEWAMSFWQSHWWWLVVVVAVVVERCSGVDKPGPKPGCQRPHLMFFTTKEWFRESRLLYSTV